jgi:hypothetical protein
MSMINFLLFNNLAEPHYCLKLNNSIKNIFHILNTFLLIFYNFLLIVIVTNFLFNSPKIRNHTNCNSIKHLIKLNKMSKWNYFSTFFKILPLTKFYAFYKILLNVSSLIFFPKIYPILAFLIGLAILIFFGSYPSTSTNFFIKDMAKDLSTIELGISYYRYSLAFNNPIWNLCISLSNSINYWWSVPPLTMNTTFSFILLSYIYYPFCI